MSTYANARATIATAIEAVLTGWTVADHPTDRPGSRTVAIGVGRSQRANRGVWRRELAIGLFVGRTSVADSLDLLDANVPTVIDALLDLDGVAVPDDLPEPRSVKVGDIDYLVQFIPITIETTHS